MCVVARGSKALDKQIHIYTQYMYTYLFIFVRSSRLALASRAKLN